MPQPTDPQSLNRYSYVRNNPTNYSDPTGYCRYNDDGEFEYATDCTVDEFAQLSWDDRILWMNLFMDETGVRWFYNIIGILEFFRDDLVFSRSVWASYSDAGVLQAIQDGWRMHRGDEPIGTGGSEWETFFSLYAQQQEGEGIPRSLLMQQWGIAEQSGVDYGLTLANQFAEDATFGERVRIEIFVGASNLYRSLLSGGNIFVVEPSMSDYQLIGDATVALLVTPALDPSTQFSRHFVREVSRQFLSPGPVLYGGGSRHHTQFMQ